MNPQTIREHLEAIIHRADKGSYNGRPLDALEGIGADAVAALELLNNAVRGDHGAYPYSPGPIRQYVYVHDPAPRGDAE